MTAPWHPDHVLSQVDRNLRWGLQAPGVPEVSTDLLGLLAREVTGHASGLTAVWQSLSKGAKADVRRVDPSLARSLERVAESVEHARDVIDRAARERAS